MLGRVDQGFVDIKAMALNAAIKGSILAEPEACFVTSMALPFGSTRALATAHDIGAVSEGSIQLSAYANLTAATAEAGA
jgi:hypothetical protein